MTKPQPETDKLIEQFSGRNRTAAEATIQALRDAKRLNETDSARVTALQALADAVDADPSNASLWREYRAVELALREVQDDDIDELSELLGKLSAPMGDASNTISKDLGIRSR